MKVLVSGGTGFVGKPFVRRILTEGWQVTLITRDARHAAPLAHEHLRVEEADVAAPDQIERLARPGDAYDAVFHLAASLQYFGDRKALYRTNVQGTRAMLDLAVQTSARKFIYASSIEAMGTVARQEVPAPADRACTPISPYGETKVLAERLVMEAARSRFPAMALRIGNVYGPGQPSFMIEIAQAVLHRTRLLEFLPFYADRYIHPVHSDDVTEGLLAAFRSDVPAFVGTLAGEYATLGELFQLCGEILGQPVPLRSKRRLDGLFLIARREFHKYERHMDFITYLMAGRGRRVHRAYSIQETRRALGFSPKVSLREGIAETLHWARRSGVLPW